MKLTSGHDNRRRKGVSLVEILVVIGVISLLCALLMPVLSNAKGRGRRVRCLNNLRQLDIAAMIFADEHNDALPARSKPFWMETLRPDYVDFRILVCPDDPYAENWSAPDFESYRVPRSYALNGWNDYFQSRLSAEEFGDYMNYRGNSGMPVSELKEPADTIVFGEKRPLSKHIHVDIYQGMGNDIEEVAHAMHTTTKAGSGGSHFAFADGSVRFLPPYGSVSPRNLWAVTASGRLTAVVNP